MPMRFSSIAGLFAALLTTACMASASADGHKGPIAYDDTRPAITEYMKQPAILVFSKTRDWRHNEGIAGADLFFAQLSREQGYGLFTTVNGAVFNAEDLARFEIIVFNNVTGDVLSPEQEAAFQKWLTDGGAWIGIHGSGDNSHGDWPWYAKSVIGPTFTGHPMNPQFSEAPVVTLAPGHPIMENVPARWLHVEEWYSFDSLPGEYGLTALAGIDETAIWPAGKDYPEEKELRMGNKPADHPIMWTGCIGAGRLFYSALGHSDEAYENPVNRQILKNSFQWVRKQSDPKGAHCPAKAELAK